MTSPFPLSVWLSQCFIFDSSDFFKSYLKSKSCSLTTMLCFAYIQLEKDEQLSRTGKVFCNILVYVNEA